MIGYITGLSIDGKNGHIQAYGEFSAYGNKFGSEVGQYTFEFPVNQPSPVLAVGMNVNFTLNEGKEIVTLTPTGGYVTPSFGKEF